MQDTFFCFLLLVPARRARISHVLVCYLQESYNKENGVRISCLGLLGLIAVFGVCCGCHVRLICPLHVCGSWTYRAWALNMTSGSG